MKTEWAGCTASCIGLKFAAYVAKTTERLMKYVVRIPQADLRGQIATAMIAAPIVVPGRQMTLK
jgi:hypothetical protein